MATRSGDTLDQAARAGSATGEHVPELDGIRAIAVALVVLFHCRNAARAESAVERTYLSIAEGGWIGVDLFFVLSGFLITGILLDTFRSPGYFRSFYTRRVLRIFPLYYAALILTAIGAHVLHIDRLASPSPTVEVAHWLYLQNWLPLLHAGWTRHLAHFWSLGIEEQFYIVWPAIILFAARRGVVQTLCLGTIVAAVLMRLVFWSAGLSEAANFATITRMDALAIGGLLAYRFRARGVEAISTRSVYWTLAAAAAAVSVIVLSERSFFRPTNPLIMPFGYLPLAVFWAGVVALAVVGTPDGRFRRMLRSRPARGLGRISYGIYVFHWPLVLLFQPYWRTLPWSYWTKEATFLAFIALASITLAALSYRFFELPFLRLKYRLAPYRETPTQSAVDVKLPKGPRNRPITNSGKQPTGNPPLAF